MATGDHRSGLWIKGLLSECVRQKAFVCRLLSADNCTVNESLPTDQIQRKQESKKYTV